MIYFRHYLAKFLYNALWIPLYFTFKFFVHYRIIYQDRSIRHIEGPILIVANHSSVIDPFFISGPFPMGSRVFPLHFAVWPILFLIPFVNIFAWAMGSFGVRKGIGLERALKEPLKFLEKGWTVGIFPQGARSRPVGGIRKSRRGAGYIALKNNPTIIPVYVHGARALAPWVFFSRARHITVYTGAPFRLPQEMHIRNNAEEVSEFLMERLFSLGEGK